MLKSLTEVQIARYRDEGSPIFKMLPLSNPVFTTACRYSHIGGQKSVSRGHSADWPTAKLRFADQPQIFVQRVTKDWTSPAHRACIPKASRGHS
jgi:hypothetical protein